MPAANHSVADIINSDVQREHQFDMTSLATFVLDNEQLLTAERRNNDPLGSRFSEHLLDIGNGRIPLHEDTQYIQLPEIFATLWLPKRN
ncbi:hypothetical protein TNCV_4802681 [Trichonephila clavipes]|nr:hypothetical protein TNCV_4802681 [Trichonephila clavipes]